MFLSGHFLSNQHLSLVAQAVGKDACSTGGGGQRAKLLPLPSGDGHSGGKIYPSNYIYTLIEKATKLSGN